MITSRFFFLEITLKIFVATSEFQIEWMHELNMPERWRYNEEIWLKLDAHTQNSTFQISWTNNRTNVSTFAYAIERFDFKNATEFGGFFFVIKR